jgi:hypothetical protein
MTASGFDRSSYVTIGSRERDVGRAVVADEDVVLPFRRVSSGLERRILTSEHMTIQRMDHVGIVVDDLAAATEFFVELGLELQGEGLSKFAGWTASWGSRAYGRGSR